MERRIKTKDGMSKETLTPAQVQESAASGNVEARLELASALKADTIEERLARLELMAGL